MSTNSNTGASSDDSPSVGTAIDNEIGEHDVLLGRGGLTNTNGGNKKFRALVALHQQEYLNARKLDKAPIAQRIVGIIRSKGGRFLKKNEETDSWEDVGDKKARQKTSQALREGLDVRKNSDTAIATAALTANSTATAAVATSGWRRPYSDTNAATATIVMNKRRRMIDPEMISSGQFDDAGEQPTTAVVVPELAEENSRPHPSSLSVHNEEEKTKKMAPKEEEPGPEKQAEV